MIGAAAAVAIGGIGGATSGAAGAGAAAEAATSTCEFCSEEVAQPRGFPDKQHTVDKTIARLPSGLGPRLGAGVQAGLAKSTRPGLQRGCASKNVVSRHRRKATIPGSDLQLLVSTTSR